MSRRRELAAGLGRRADELFERVVAPLVLGGAIRPVRPLGSRLALALLEGHEPADRETFARVELARVRRARELCPVDTLPPPSGAEWALAAVLSDLVQATNPDLASAFGASRPRTLVRHAVATLSRLPRVRTAGEALARHATFAQVLATTRVDTAVSWWTGHETFAGRAPPARLLAWPALRRVRLARTERKLAALATGCPRLDPDEHRRALAALVAASPLTDLAAAARTEPPFAFGAASLALLSTDAGLWLAFRAIDRAGPPAGTLAALVEAAKSIAGAADPLPSRVRALIDVLRTRPEAPPSASVNAPSRPDDGS